MELAQHYTEVEWNGHSVHLPINQRLDRWRARTPNGAPATKNLVGCEWIPGTPRHAHEVNLDFAVTMGLPLNKTGELYYTFFAQVKGFTVKGIENGRLLLGFSAMAVCNVEDDNAWGPDVVHCGLEAVELEADPDLERKALTEKYEDSHVCAGRIEDAVWIVHELGTSPTLSPENDWIVDEAASDFDGDIWSAGTDEAREGFRRSGDEVFVDDFTQDGKTYRVIVLTHQD